MRRRAGLAALLAVLPAAGCTPNPRSEIPAIAEAALTEVARTALGQALCVERTIAPWRPALEARRIDPPAPPNFGDLYAPGVFRGGGGLKGDSVGGIAVAGRPGCLDLRGPLVAGDHAMIEVHSAGSGLNLFLRRQDGPWHVVMTTTSAYPG